ncbi:MAG: alanine-tRNA synthetase second additional domain-containing protein [Lentisphaerae bacterium]|nr:alanine-tRNA synthetase second additional domain-containing protein [Lentisphaerota bacterium]MCP4101816.1 alanine-tRNA synthetase second additional domain-containing protein [Lentisphaerota bacterium]
MPGRLLENNLITAQYHAPRGKRRLYRMAHFLSQRYLDAEDRLVGIIGCEGSGKSTLIRGLFPGLELTNDDDGINNRRAPLYDFSEDDYFAGHTFHIDIRFESAFHQLFEIAEAVNRAITAGKRVVVEHFDLIYNHLGYNAQIIFAIGEDLRVFRPTVFGPSPLDIKSSIEKNAKYRLMAHSAEDLTCWLLKNVYNCKLPELHSDVKHGFVIGFPEEPNFDINELENRIKELIKQDIPIKAAEGNYIEVRKDKIYCTGKRIHVKSTGEIENFRLLKKFFMDPISKEYLLVGLAGQEEITGFSTLPPKNSEEDNVST